MNIAGGFFNSTHPGRWNGSKTFKPIKQKNSSANCCLITSGEWENLTNENFASGDGFMPSATKLFPGPILTQICVNIWRH